MTVLASILLLALTRAELVDRLRAAPMTKCDGLVRVYGDCPADMRREFMGSVAGAAADVCRSLASAQSLKLSRFSEPGIVIHIGDIRTNVTNVVMRSSTRSNGDRYARIYLPAPGAADLRSFQLSVIRAFYLAVKNEVIDDATAYAALVAANPDLRVAEERAELADWRERGSYAPGKSDEDYLQLQRKVLKPGVAAQDDVLTFASRLRLYPMAYALPFCGKYDSCTFAEAILHAKTDPSVRLAAFVKSRQVAIFGGGRGEELASVAEAYSSFLMELARFKKTEIELARLLSEADEKLKGLMRK